MKKIKFWALSNTFILLIVFVSCNENKKQKSEMSISDHFKNVKRVFIPKWFPSTGYTDLENKIIDTIFNLVEVKHRQKEIETSTKPKKLVQIGIIDTPNSKNTYYWVRLLIEGNYTYDQQLSFHVYKFPLRIMYYDIIGDSEFILKDWRRLKKLELK